MISDPAFLYTHNSMYVDRKVIDFGDPVMDKSQKSHGILW